MYEVNRGNIRRKSGSSGIFYYNRGEVRNKGPDLRVVGVPRKQRKEWVLKGGTEG